MDKKKVIATTVATVTAASLLLGGTFAWYNAQNAVNEFTGDISHGSVLHDDFDGTNKDVYVENTGTAAIFVRIKLDEYLETLEKDVAQANPMLEGSKRDDVSTWNTHLYTKGDVANDGQDFHKYYTWTMGGDKVEYKPASVNSSGVVGKYTTYNSTSGKQLAQITPDGFTPNADGNKFTPASKVMKMADYLELEDNKKTEFVGWLLDTDGWAYWYEKLATGEVTGLLLDKVENIATPETGDSFYYAINVAMQTVTESDITAWTEGATINTDPEKTVTPGRGTDNAVQFLKDTSSKYVKITTAMTKTTAVDGFNLDAKSKEFDTDEDGYFDETEYAAYKAALVKAGAGFAMTLTEGTPNTAVVTGFITSVTTLTDVSGYDATTNTLTMPTTVTRNGVEYTVTEIGDQAFRDTKSIAPANWVLPGKLKKLNNSAFIYAKITGVVTIPATVEYIGSNVFNAATGITGYIFEGTNNTTVYEGEQASTLYIDVNAFRNNVKGTLGVLVLPDRIYTFGLGSPANNSPFNSAGFTKIYYSDKNSNFAASANIPEFTYVTAEDCISYTAKTK